MKLPSGQSPCRPHPCSVEHADVVYTYRAMRAAWEEAMAAECLGYATEEAEYRERNPPPVLRDVLVHNRRRQ